MMAEVRPLKETRDQRLAQVEFAEYRAYVLVVLEAGLGCPARLFELSDTNYSGKGRMTTR